MEEINVVYTGLLLVSKRMGYSKRVSLIPESLSLPVPTCDYSHTCSHHCDAIVLYYEALSGAEQMLVPCS